MPEFRVHFIRIPRWQLMLGAGLGLVLIAAFFVLALGIFLLLLPAIAAAGVLFYLFGRRPPVADRASHDRVIEGDYRVIEQDRIEQRDPSKR
jgi:uncharacterized membrane protein